MLRVLLADDEPFIVQGMAVLIDWEKEGYEIAATVANGMEALEYLKQNEVDLIIADIKMPVMTGLELLEKIRAERISEAYFVILSGYNDFHYAQQAIRFKCMDYILKPIRQEELTAILRKAASLHETSEQKLKESRQRENAYLEINVLSVLTGKYDQQNLDYVRKQLRLSPGIRYIDIVIDEKEWLDGALADEECQNERRKGIQRKLYQNCKKYLGNDDCGYFVLDVSGSESAYHVGFVYCQYMAEERDSGEREFLEDFLYSIQQDIEFPVIMFVGCRVDDIADIQESYRTSAVIKSFHAFRASQDIYYYEEENAKSNSGAVLCKNILDELIREIEQNNQEGIDRSVDCLYDEMNRVGAVNLNINYLLFQLIHLAVQQDAEVNQEEILHGISKKTFAGRSTPGSKENMKRFAGDYAEYLAQLRRSGAVGILMDIEREVREHYAGNLTLKELSGKYYVNSAYLGQIFRRKHGVSFKDYLNNYRMEQAACLLLRTDKRVYEIAEEVGCRNLDYFINRFITFKGCTPARYRKQSREIK